MENIIGNQLVATLEPGELQTKLSLIHKCMAGLIGTDADKRTAVFDMLYDMDVPTLGATLTALEQARDHPNPELSEKEKRILTLKKQLVDVLAKLKNLQRYNEDTALLAIYEKHKDTLITEWRNLTGKFNFP